MRFTADNVYSIAEQQGFQPVLVEKVLHLMGLLNEFTHHPYLKTRWCLKGGTALNLFIFPLPRLSVDIDVNYTGTVTLDGMLKERPLIEKSLQDIFSRAGFQVKRIPRDHAGGKWRLNYTSFTGQSGNLEVDVNFMLRQPLWTPVIMDSISLGDTKATGIPVLDIHELAGGKLAALFSRSQPRDLFDTYSISRLDTLDTAKMRTAFIVYGGMNRLDWRTISLQDIASDPELLKNRLLPTLHHEALGSEGDPASYGEYLIEQCAVFLSRLVPFTTDEMQFLDQLLEFGNIVPDLLTGDPALQKRIAHHPQLRWKALNVRKFKGLG